MNSEKEIETFLFNLEHSEETLTDADMQILFELADSPISYFKAQVAALLADHYDEKSVEVLLRLTYDKNELVRIEAADSIGIAKSTEVIDRLLDLLENDSSHLVRGYAILSTYDIYINLYNDTEQTKKAVLKLLFPFYQKEKHTWTLVNYYQIFYQCGQKIYLQNLLDSLKDEDSDSRHYTISSFFEILSPENENIIRETVLFYYKTETMKNEKTYMEKLLDYIDNYEWED